MDSEKTPMCERCHDHPATHRVYNVTPEYITNALACDICAVMARTLGMTVTKLENKGG